MFSTGDVTECLTGNGHVWILNPVTLNSDMQTFHTQHTEGNSSLPGQLDPKD